MIYLDHAATAPVWPQVTDAVVRHLTEGFANPSALYSGARDARKAIESARELIAEAFTARPEEVIFTSGGTEADNIALLGSARRLAPQGRTTIVVSAVEHHAVLEAAAALSEEGLEVRMAPVTSAGVVDLDRLSDLVDSKTSVVSVMAANNETGVVMPLDGVAEIAHAAGALLHTDAVQALAWLDLRGCLADMIAVSAHKIGGPKGVGALIVRRGSRPQPIQHGGGQERGIRPGTLNTPGIAGFGAALEQVLADREAAARVRSLRDHLQGQLSGRIDGLIINGHDAPRLPGHLHMCIPGVENQSLLLLLDSEGLAASGGSACQSGAAEPSHVLLAMGHDTKMALSALRLSLGRATTRDEVDEAARIITRAVERLSA
ncbi:MAG: cysteine desulfurase family protein [Actinomycetota bacterium]